MHLRGVPQPPAAAIFHPLVRLLAPAIQAAIGSDRMEYMSGEWPGVASRTMTIANRIRNTCMHRERITRKGNNNQHQYQ